MKGSATLRNALPLDNCLPPHAEAYPITLRNTAQTLHTDWHASALSFCSGPAHLYDCTSTGPAAPVLRWSLSRASMLPSSSTAPTLFRHRSSMSNGASAKKRNGPSIFQDLVLPMASS